MTFDNFILTPENFAAIIAGLVVGIVIVSFVIPALKDRKKKRATIELIKKEDERIANLPKLSTRYLLKIPSGATNFRKGEPRTFGNRYNRLIVFDENGDGWLGLFMPSTFQGLHDGEYIQQNYWVPFRGSGEAYSGDPVVIDGRRIDIYPIWMNSTATDTPDWKTWVAFDKAFDEAHRGVSSSDEFRQFTPFERSHELERKRKEFDAMRASVAPQKK